MTKDEQLNQSLVESNCLTPAQLEALRLANIRTFGQFLFVAYHPAGVNSLAGSLGMSTRDVQELRSSVLQKSGFAESEFSPTTFRRGRGYVRDRF